MADEKGPTVLLVIPFETARLAEVAYNSLSVDHEPKRSRVTKSMSVKDNELSVSMVAQETRQLRLSVNTFFDHLALVEKTINQFSLEKIAGNRD